MYYPFLALAILAIAVLLGCAALTGIGRLLCFLIPAFKRRLRQTYYTRNKLGYCFRIGTSFAFVIYVLPGIALAVVGEVPLAVRIFGPIVAIGLLASGWSVFKKDLFW